MNNDRFRVGTFNLYNLASPERQYYDRQYTKADYRLKLDWLRNQLTRMDCDIVGFQEIFHVDAMEETLTGNSLYDNATLIAPGENGERPVVGLASRFKVLGYESITSFPEDARLDFDGLAIPITQFSRPVLRVRLQISSVLDIVVFVVHLKSKNPMIPEDQNRHDPLQRAIGKARSLIRRAAEATALRSLLIDYMRNNNDPVIVLGDINDTGHAVTSEIITGSPPWRRQAFDQKLSIWDVLLYNVNDIQARQSYRDVYYSHIHNGHYESLDHILVSQELVRQNPQHVGYVEYVQVLNDHLLDDTLSDKRIPRWQSDHGQAVATIHMRH